MLVFDRNANANWRIVNTGGTLKFQTDYDSSKKETYYDCFNMQYNTGNLWIRGLVTVGGGMSIEGITTLKTTQYNGLQIARKDENGSSIAFSNSSGSLGKIGFGYGGQLIIGNASDGDGNYLTIESNLVATFKGPVKATNFIGTVEYADKIKYFDTRNANTAPSGYTTGIKWEFKTRSTIASPYGGGTYSGLLTLKPYSDNSGGQAYQMNFGYNSTWPFISVRTAPVAGTSWNGGWRYIVMSENASVINLYAVSISTWNNSYAGYVNGTIAFCW